MVEGVFQGVDADAVFVDGDAVDVDAAGFGDVDDAEVGGVSGEQGIAVAHQRLQDEVDGLLGAAGDQHIFDAAVDADGADVIAHGASQRGVAFRRLVGEGVSAVALDDLVDGVLQVAHGEEVAWAGRRR